MDISKTSNLADNYLKLAKKYNKPRKGMKSRWTTKYKRSIDCNNPKGFSQKAYCARKRRGGSYKNDVNDLEWLDKAVTTFKETAQQIASDVSKKVEELKKSYEEKKLLPKELHESIDKIKWKAQEAMHQAAQQAKADNASKQRVDEAHQDVAQQIEQDTESTQAQLESEMKLLEDEVEGGHGEFVPQAPIKGTYFSSGGFGQTSSTKFHDGVDLRSETGGGTPIYPIETGTVLNTNVTYKGGNTVKIKHDDGIHSSYYAHMKDVYVKPGDRVSKDTAIGTIGDTGNAKWTIPHLHIEVYLNNQLVNPKDYFTVPSYTDFDPTKEVKWSEEANV